MPYRNGNANVFQSGRCRALDESHCRLSRVGWSCPAWCLGGLVVPSGGATAGGGSRVRSCCKQLLLTPLCTSSCARLRSCPARCKPRGCPQAYDLVIVGVVVVDVRTSTFLLLRGAWGLPRALHPAWSILPPWWVQVENIVVKNAGARLIPPSPPGKVVGALQVTQKG